MEAAVGSNAVAVSDDGWIASVRRTLSSMGAAAAAVSSCGGACVVELIGVSVGCRGGSLAWTRGGSNSFGIAVVAPSLSDVTGEGLSGRDVGVTDVSVFGASEVLRSVDGAG